MSISDPLMTEGISRRQFLRWGVGAATGALLGSGLSLHAHSGAADVSSSAGTAEIIRHVYTKARRVCVTYDDLWNEFNTTRICRAYYRRDVRLTLFPIGRAVDNNLERPNAGYENLYPRLRDMGHEFGCHLFTHRDITSFSLQQLIDEELEPALAVLRRALGPEFQPIGIRPPYGIMTDALRQLSKQYDIPLVLWGLDSQDAVCTKENGAENCQELILSNYEGYLRPGSIILHHAIKAAYLAIEPTLELLSDWNMKPIPLTELLTYAPKPDVGDS